MANVTVGDIRSGKYSFLYHMNRQIYNLFHILKALLIQKRNCTAIHGIYKTARKLKWLLKSLQYNKAFILFHQLFENFMGLPNLRTGRVTVGCYNMDRPEFFSCITINE